MFCHVLWIRASKVPSVQLSLIHIFQKALESGCDGIELDVQLTKDGEVVIIHDEYLDDLTDFTGNVRDYTLGE